MSHEQIVYTRSWAEGLGRDVLRDCLRTIAFGVTLLLGFLALIGPFFLNDSQEVEPELAPAILLFLFVQLPVFILCCRAAIWFAEEEHWKKPEPTLWDDCEARWITSTVSFSHYLESRGEHIHASLVRHEDPRMVAHRMIDKMDERTLNLYLSILSAVEVERVRVDSADVTPRKIEGKINP